MYWCFVASSYISCSSWLWTIIRHMRMSIKWWDPTSILSGDQDWKSKGVGMATPLMDNPWDELCNFNGSITGIYPTFFHVICLLTIPRRPPFITWKCWDPKWDLPVEKTHHGMSFGAESYGVPWGWPGNWGIYQRGDITYSCGWSWPNPRVETDLPSPTWKGPAVWSVRIRNRVPTGYHIHR